MAQISATARERIQAQGFCGVSDATYAQINYPLRLSPAIMMVWVAVGTVLGSADILWALVPFTALGAILTGHPFDVLYNQGLRYLMGRPELPRYGIRRRFRLCGGDDHDVAGRMGIPSGRAFARLHHWRGNRGLYLLAGDHRDLRPGRPGRQAVREDHV
jgi:hypothetical protein